MVDFAKGPIATDMEIAFPLNLCLACFLDEIP